MLKICFFNIIRSMKSKIGIVIMGIFATLCLLINVANGTLNNYINKDTYQGYNYRSLSVSRDLSNVSYDDIYEIEKDIESVKDVQASFLSFYYGQGVSIVGYNGNLDGKIELTTASNDSLLEIVKGTNFPNDDGYYMICPQNFYPNSDMNMIRNLKSSDMYNLNDRIGDIFKLEYSDGITKEKYIMNVKLVGLYRNQANHFDENKCFVTKNVNEKISNTYYQNDETWSIDQYSSFITIINNVENIDSVTSELNLKGYSVSPVSLINYRYFNSIFSIIKKISVVIFLLLVIFLILFIRKDFIENQYNYNLLKVIGYNKVQIYIYILIEIIIKLIMSFIISLLLLGLLGIILNIVLQYKPFIFNKLSIVIDYKFYLVIYSFFAIVSLILYSLNILLKKEKNVL